LSIVAGSGAQAKPSNVAILAELNTAMKDARRATY
jgi:hypothetical protein